MANLATLSTVIAPEVKRAARAYCSRHGLKLRHLVERALLEQLGDEIDLEAYLQRKTESTVTLETVLRRSKHAK
jgi:hypothetical protein